MREGGAAAWLVGMVGRIPVMNVMPLVDLGRQPAKATVGEPFRPCTLKAFTKALFAMATSASLASVCFSILAKLYLSAIAVAFLSVLPSQSPTRFLTSLSA